MDSPTPRPTSDAAGMDQISIDHLKVDSSALPDSDRAALVFAARMTTAGYTTTDAEVAGLVESFGEAKLVAIVLQIAYANFLDRLAMSLGLAVEPGGPVPPVEVRFAKPSSPGIPAATRPAPPSNPEARIASTASDPDWAVFNYGQLQEKLEAQRDRKPRVSIPTWEDFAAACPRACIPGPSRSGFAGACSSAADSPNSARPGSSA